MKPIYYLTVFCLFLLSSCDYFTPSYVDPASGIITTHDTIITPSCSFVQLHDITSIQKRKKGIYNNIKATANLWNYLNIEDSTIISNFVESIDTVNAKVVNSHHFVELKVVIDALCALENERNTAEDSAKYNEYRFQYIEMILEDLKKK